MNSYEAIKIVYPITTTPKKGINVAELVKAKYPVFYKFLTAVFDWNDLDGILDFLYGERGLGLMGIPEADISEIISLIESNCEIKSTGR